MSDSARRRLPPQKPLDEPASGNLHEESGAVKDDSTSFLGQQGSNNPSANQGSTEATRAPVSTDDAPIEQSGIDASKPESQPLSSDDTSPRIARQGVPAAVDAPRPSTMGRPGDNELGVAPQEALMQGPLTKDDKIRLAENERRRAARESQPIDDMPQTPGGWIRVPPQLTGPLALTFLAAFGGLLGLFVLSQVVQVITLLAAFPLWVHWLFTISASLLGLAVCYAVARVGWMYCRLRRVEQVPVKALLRLAERSSLRKLGRSPLDEKKQKAVEQLRGFLSSHAESEASLRPLAAEVRLVNAVDDLRSAREVLMNPKLFAGSDRWLMNFEERYQSKLDDIARARIQLHARRVGVKTAISPNALIDTLIAGYYGFSLLGDLCKIYNARVDHVSTAILLAWIFFNAYIAGQTHELEDAAEEQIEGFFAESQIVGLLAGKIGARTASGFLNYFLLRRLGRVAMRMLQPAATK